MVKMAFISSPKFFPVLKKSIMHRERRTHMSVRMLSQSQSNFILLMGSDFLSVGSACPSVCDDGRTELGCKECVLESENLSGKNQWGF